MKTRAHLVALAALTVLPAGAAHARGDRQACLTLVSRLWNPEGGSP
jgi:hypothetical protein